MPQLQEENLWKEKLLSSHAHVQRTICHRYHGTDQVGKGSLSDLLQAISVCIP